MADQHDPLNINEKSYEGHCISTGKANLLMIKGSLGFLGCGYFNIEVAEKIDEAVALVTGVKSYDDMLEADVFAASSAAENLGVRVGMKGKEALALLA